MPIAPTSSTIGPRTAPPAGASRATAAAAGGAARGSSRRDVAGGRLGAGSQVRATVLAEGDAGPIDRPAARAGLRPLRRAGPLQRARHAGGDQSLAAIAAEGNAGTVLRPAARALGALAHLGSRHAVRCRAARLRLGRGRCGIRLRFLGWRASRFPRRGPDVMRRGLFDSFFSRLVALGCPVQGWSVLELLLGLRGLCCIRLIGVARCVGLAGLVGSRIGLTVVLLHRSSLPSGRSGGARS